MHAHIREATWQLLRHTNMAGVESSRQGPRESQKGLWVPKTVACSRRRWPVTNSAVPASRTSWPACQASTSACLNQKECFTVCRDVRELAAGYRAVPVNRKMECNEEKSMSSVTSPPESLGDPPIIDRPSSKHANVLLLHLQRLELA